PGRGHPVLRAGLTIVAVVGAVLTARAVGTAETWFDLDFLLLVAAAPLVFAVAWISAQLMGLAASPLRRLGPTARLAATPLVVRRGHLGPIAAAVGLVVTLAVLEGVVGASFGAREAGRDRADVVLGETGTSDDQLIVSTSNLPADETRRVAAEAATGKQVRLAVIDQLGEGGTETRPDIRAESPPRSRIPARLTELDVSFVADDFVAVPPGVSVAVDAGSSWVGVATAADLSALGLADLGPALERGEAVVLNPDVAGTTTIALEGPDGAEIGRLPAARSGADEHGLLLPAVVVSPAVADGLGQARYGGRAVVVPTDPESRRAGSDTVEVAFAIHDHARKELPDVAGTESEGVAASARYVESQEPPARGDEEVVRDAGGPLNALSFMSGTASEGRSRGFALAVAALLVCVAGTILVLGGSRAEDAVLEAQGAEPRTRVVVAAVQAGAVALTASVLGGLAGIGLPVLAMTSYNDRDRVDGLPDIPVVIPVSVAVLLVVLPVAAAVIAAVVVRSRPLAPAADLALLDA
ncbi:MAG TPA: FtsX-like permease family protein, partial [Iamia sp.]|nr:FtsX-like permease family protein [Iamia sp.]